MIVIPARYGSTRLPVKPLANLCGKPMVQHVYERARQAKLANEVVIATDDERIFKVAQSFDGHVIMTSSRHTSGTDRVAEVNAKYQAEVVVNLQGDLPLIQPATLDTLISGFCEPGQTAPMGTLKSDLSDPTEIENPNLVKVVTDLKGMALYFSRSPIPFARDGKQTQVFRHIGVYIFQRQFLPLFSQLPPSPLEKAESLEQLRALENGYPIRVFSTSQSVVEVDTSEDLQKASLLLSQQ